MKGFNRWVSTPKGFIIYCIMLVVALPLLNGVMNIPSYELEKAQQMGVFSHWWKPALLGLVLAVITRIVIYAISENKASGKEFKSSYKDDEPTGI